ncbi:hypothetical protein PS6_011835 [Mucor atramentarius]
MNPKEFLQTIEQNSNLFKKQSSPPRPHQVEYRYKIATSLLSEIAKAQPPCINHRRHKQFYNIFVVEFPEQTIIPDITDEEIEAGIIDPFVYLEDIEGGELNPEEQKQFTIDEFLLDE